MYLFQCGDNSVTFPPTMRALALLPLLYIHSTFAAPASDGQIVLGEAAALVDALREGFVPKVENDVATVIHNGENEDKVETWEEKGKEFVKQNGLVCTYFHNSRVSLTQLRNREDEVVKHSALPNYQLRTTKPHLCDPSVKQYSGYLDVTDGKHLFFW